VIRKSVTNDPDSPFVADLSDVVMMFVQKTLCVGYLKEYLPEYVNTLRPKVQQLLFDSDKVRKF
jgi:hypothetical protein